MDKLINDVQINVIDFIDNLRFDFQHSPQYVMNTSALTNITERGNWIMMNCPNHSESRPSFGISNEPPYVCNCFYCGGLGTLDQVVEKLLGLSKGQGIHYILASVGYVENVKVDLNKLFTNNQKPTPLGEDILLQYLSEDSPEYKIGLDYLKKRGLSEKTIQTYQIGFDKENQCVTFPQRERKGNLRFIQKRKVSPKAINRFINDGQAIKKDILFGLHFIDKFKTSKTPIRKVRLVESPIDVLSNYQVGIASVALNGLILFPQQIRELQLAGVSSIELMLDNDDAGKKATIEVRNKLLKVGFLVQEIVYPNTICKDANDLLKANLLQKVLIKPI